LKRDTYNSDLYAKENEQLRQAKADFEEERNQMFNDIRNLESENERVFSENKELKRKIKKLEHILYGRK
jgi:predicted  nucleic acid-binding Zn-ribbon protein